MIGVSILALGIIVQLILLNYLHIYVSRITSIIDCCLYLLVMSGPTGLSILLCTFCAHRGSARLLFDCLTCGRWVVL